MDAGLDALHQGRFERSEALIEGISRADSNSKGTALSTCVEAHVEPGRTPGMDAGLDALHQGRFERKASTCGRSATVSWHQPLS